MRGARVLVVDQDPAELERLAELVRAVGAKVMAMGKPDALKPMARVFRPDLAVLGVYPPELEVARAGRRLHRTFKGALPILYVGDLHAAPDRRFCLEEGGGVEVVPRAHAADELPLRVRRLVELQASLHASVREQLSERTAALHDEVTGLYNRPFLLEMVSAEARRAERHGGSFSVLIAELDDFLALRDRYGDEVCERLMVYCSVLLRQALREADVVARVGRYHFGALLPAMPAEAVSGFVERLRRRFAMARMMVEGEAVRAQMTFGVATFPDVVGPAQQIFSKAIQELDRARETSGSGPRAAV